MSFQDLSAPLVRSLKLGVRSFLRYFGFDIIFYNPSASGHAQEHAFFKYLNIRTVLDVGANSGEFALSLRDGGFKGNIVSIEPLSVAHQKLVIRSDRDPRWLVMPRCAVGNFSGVIDINVSKKSDCSSIMPVRAIHLDADPDSAYVSKENVDIVTVDGLMSCYAFASPLLIKIDVQGYEMPALEGAINTLAVADGLLIELSLVALYEGQALWQEIISFLESHHFVLWGIYNGFTNHQTGQSLQVNALFKKAR